MRQIPENETPDVLPELMVRYQAGEMAAFEEIYRCLERSLRGYLRSLVAPGVELEDLLQNAFLQVHRSRRTYLPGQPVRPWVFAIARNVGLMARRSSGRRARRETLADTELPEIAVPSNAFATLDRLTLERALVSIADPGREALWLESEEASELKRFRDDNSLWIAEDHNGSPVYLAPDAWKLKVATEDYPKIRFLTTKEQEP
jgi:DNA-directed RNA polymerase specialized sigma24 family protein